MPDVCPRCNSDDIHETDQEMLTDQVERFIKCETCQFEWVEFFQCTGWGVTGELYEAHKDERVFKPDEKWSEIQ